MKGLMKYRKTFSLSLKNSMEYRLSFFLSIFSCAFPIMIQFFLWSAAYSSKKTEIFGYSYLQITAYSILASLDSKLTAAGF